MTNAELLNRRSEEAIMDRSKYTLPSIQAMLALAIIVLMAVVVLTLLWRDKINLDQNTFGALLTLLGVLAACFKDVFAWAFGSSQKEEKKDDTIATVALSPTPPPPIAPPTTTTTTTQPDGTRTTVTEPAAVGATTTTSVVNNDQPKPAGG